MSVSIDTVKCACSDCVCIMGTEKGIKRDGRIFCSGACADHHKDGAGCNHAGCTCHG